VSLGILAYVGSRLRAQPTTANPAPQTKVAMVNIGQVIKGYAKWKVYQEEFKAKVDVFEAKAKELKKSQEDYAKAAQNPSFSAEQRDQYEKAVKTVRNQLQDLSDDAKSQLGKMQADQYTILYNDVRTIVSEMAGARGLELVFQYNDVFAGDPAANALSVQRRLTSDGALPIYAAPGMDISQAVMDTLNARYKSAMPGTPTAAAPGAGGR